MRGMTDLSMAGTASRFAAVAAACLLAVACSELKGPNAPASVTGTATNVGQGADKTWQEFQAQGWNCRTVQNGTVVVCSPPGQPLPVPAFFPAEPPADRAPTVMLKRWRNGVFEANVHLIRPELYQGQLCEPTGELYVYAAVLGYYECAHPPIE